MTDSGRHAVGPHRGIVVTGSVFGAVALTIGAVAASLAVAMARTVVSPPRKRKEDTAVLAVDRAAGTVTLGATPDAVLPGHYSFWFAEGAGHARLGDVVSKSADTVTRTILGVDHGDLEHARRGRFNGWLYLSPADLGFDYESVDVVTPVGVAPAWLVAASSPTERWAIHVHGRAVTRAETLRGLPVFHGADYTSLVVSYRNDGEAPASTDGKYALGDTEWRDVEAAVTFALDHGARSIVLVGWSMGGATVLQMATRSSLAGVVRGIVLDSPVIDWKSALDFQAKLAHLPACVGVAARSIIGGSWGRVLTGQEWSIDLDRLDLVRTSAKLSVPILIMHSDDDGYVPSTASHALALARPDIVTMETFENARHTKLWNYDP
ncbi:MAG: alpha/beta fold hydrolase, partial [Lacisediminihabitans sp.]